MRTRAITIAISLLLLTAFQDVLAEVREEKINEVSFITFVSGEAWQPEGYATSPLLHAVPAGQVPVIDGKADDPAWAAAKALTLPLNHGTVAEATLKAVYTEQDVYLLVSWPDASRDDQYHPWVWDGTQGRYVEDPQEEDGLVVSIEAGCDWNALPLSGYVYDFDGWRWLAARTDPIGQAVDTSGHVQDRGGNDMGYTHYRGREQKPFWNMKFDGRGGPDVLTKTWQELNRVYMYMPIQGEEVYVSMNPDDSTPGQIQEFTKHVSAPSEPMTVAVDNTGLRKVTAREPAQEIAVVPQYLPIRLEGDSGEVAAKGYWADGRWTVEFRRARITPAKTATDSIFDRTTQFSLHVFDHTERLDEASESGRILLQFEAAGGWPAVVGNDTSPSNR